MAKDWLKLSLVKIKYLLKYYSFTLFCGISLTIVGLLYEHNYFQLTITSASIIGAFGTALIGSSVFYVRKLYKSCINVEMSIPQTHEDNIREIGVFAYYLLRPIFSMVFSLIIHISLKAAVSIITVKESVLDNGMVYLCMLLSFFGGFAAGDFITLIEKRSSKILEKIIND